jgi:hypothetical protein
LATPQVLIMAVSLRDTVVQAAHFASESHIQTYLYFYSWILHKPYFWDGDASAANGSKEPSLPNAVLQHFASAEKLALLGLPKAAFQQPPRMLRCGPSKRPLVHGAAISWVR